MDKPIVVQQPREPDITFFLEYEDRKRPQYAYLYPCSESGVAKKDLIKDTNQFLSVSSDDEHFIFKGVREIKANSQRLLLVCSCKYVFFFDSWETTEQSCPNCNRYWKSSDLLS